MSVFSIDCPKAYYLLSCVFLLFSCSPKEEKGEQDKVPVKVQLISPDSTTHLQEYVGTVESERTVDISFLVPGTIEELYAYEGQQVSKGQLLASLNTVSLKNSHEMALSALNQAQDAYNRLSDMYKNKSLPEIQYIDAKTKFEQAVAAEVIAKKNLQDGKLYAPQSGVIGKRYFEPGANVMPGNPVYTLMDIHQVKVKVAIPEGEISQISKGAPCTVRISALNNERFEGQVIEKGIAANPVSHTYDVKIKVNNPSGKIMPGMVCRAYLDQPGLGGAGNIIVPIKAVQVDYSGKRFVWLKDKEGKAAYREVSLGRLAENGVQIREGLKAGDALIVEGYQHVSVGTKVSPIN